MPDESLRKAFDAFVFERMNDVGMNQPEYLDSAVAELEKAALELKARLPDELLPLYLECENAFSLFDAAIQEAYYRAGFSDAMNLPRLLEE